MLKKVRASVGNVRMIIGINGSDSSTHLRAMFSLTFSAMSFAGRLSVTRLRPTQFFNPCDKKLQFVEIILYIEIFVRASIHSGAWYGIVERQGRMIVTL